MEASSYLNPSDSRFEKK